MQLNGAVDRAEKGLNTADLSIVDGLGFRRTDKIILIGQTLETAFKAAACAVRLFSICRTVEPSPNSSKTLISGWRTNTRRICFRYTK
jgi:hypothetical protein